MTWLEKSICVSGISTDTPSQGVASIAVESGWNIKGYYRNRTAVHGIDCQSKMSFDITLQACSKETVDYKISRGKLNFTDRISAGYSMNRNCKFLNYIQICFCVTCNAVRIDKQIDNHFSTVLVQVPRYNKTITAIIAWSGKNNSSFTGRITIPTNKAVTRLTAGIFHKDNAGYAKFMNCCIIKFAHLFRQSKLHIYPPCWSEKIPYTPHYTINALTLRRISEYYATSLLVAPLSHFSFS